MSLAIIKIEPEEAIGILSGHIATGYRTKDLIAESLIAGTMTKEIANKEFKEWADLTIKSLLKIFNTQVEALVFRNAGDEKFRFTRGNELTIAANVRTKMSAQLSKLVHYRDEILKYYGSQINFVVADTLIVQKKGGAGFIVMIIAGLLVAYLAFHFGWSS